MARFNCFSSLLIPKKKKSDKSINPRNARRFNIMRDLHAKAKSVHPSLDKGTKEASFEQKNPSTRSVVESESKDGALIKNPEVVEVAYEGSEEHDDVQSIKRDFSVIDFQALAGEKGELESPDFNLECRVKMREYNSEKNERITPEMLIESGHVSDPGMEKTMAFWVSPLLKRSCSMIERKRNGKLSISLSKSLPYEDLHNLPGHGIGESHDILGSPLSVLTSCSADKVILKKVSSSQVLPSRSRKLWWKLFIWSHRNLQRSWTLKPEREVLPGGASNQKDGYWSNTLQSSPIVDIKKKKPMEESEIAAGLWPQNQWIAFCAESSSLDKVNAWVHSLEEGPFFPIENGEISSGANCEIASARVRKHSQKNHTHIAKHALEEIVQANNIIGSLNSLHSMAHISGMGLKVIPGISAFTSLRVVNLSNNFIVRVTPGSLPKSLHTLDLSRNKISTIEGFRELMKLRVLNLNYNRILRIGHGLSNCILIKELYLVGNKISEVEGLHRLLKLTVLDLSFNKITTAKAFGQLVANYNSLLALNLLGNPIHTHIGDDQLQKVVCSLLPHLAYLNKRPPKSHRSREVVTDNVTKAALRSTDWNSRKRSTRCAVLSSSSVTKGVTNGSEQKNRHRSKSRRQHSSSTQK
ncbi:uncharacterized protein LOC121971210 [Zingiber officinale]|nr:uncharacterized protein LOC121971210 [Zingiber officinale]